MALSLNISLRNLLANAFGAHFDSGFLRVYDGTAPADADTAIGAQNLLAEVTLPVDSFAAAATGAVAKNGTWEDNDINLSGTAAWFRLADSLTGEVLQGTVTATGGGGDMTVDDVAFVAGGVFTVTGFTVTMPAA